MTDKSSQTNFYLDWEMQSENLINLANKSFTRSHEMAKGIVRAFGSSVTRC